MGLIISGNVMNLANFQQQLDEVIFDYIDSSPNWEKASNYLEEMLEQSTAYFVETVKSKGEIPSANTYWVLFTDLSAKLLYFATLALKNKTQKSKGITEEILAARYEIAAKSISNVKTEENVLFLDEIEQSFLEIVNGRSFEGRVERTPSDCIHTFYEFAKQY